MCHTKVSGYWETLLSRYLNSHNKLCFAVKVSKPKNDSLTPPLFEMEDEEPDIESYSKPYNKVHITLCPSWKSGSGTSLTTGRQSRRMQGAQYFRAEIPESCVEISRKPLDSF